MTITLHIEAPDWPSLQAEAARVLSLSPGMPPAVEESDAPVEDEKPKRGRKPKVEEDKPLISSGEERVNPEETNGAIPATALSVPKITHDDVRNAFGQYASNYGMPAVQTDGPAIISRLFGEDKIRISDIPDDPDALKQALDAIVHAMNVNEFKRPVAV